MPRESAVALHASATTITLELEGSRIILHGQEERPLAFILPSADHAREAYTGSLAAMIIGLNELAVGIERT